MLGPKIFPLLRVGEHAAFISFAWSIAARYRADGRIPVGTAATQGELWGAKARDWAEIQEPPWIPVFEQVLDLAGVGAGARLLDIGCGAGGALVLADARGAEPAGIDASEALIAVARERIPRARLEVGEMEELPFPDDSFDAVTGINAFLT